MNPLAQQSQSAHRAPAGGHPVYSLLLGILSGLMSPVSWSASTDDSRRPLDPAIPIVLTPSRLPQRLDESPSAVTIIDRDMIEASGARRLVEVLRLVPGFQVGFKVNSLPTAAYHGLADEFARRLLLLVDGQRIFQYSRGVVELNNITRCATFRAVRLAQAALATNRKGTTLFRTQAWVAPLRTTALKAVRA